MRQNRMRLPVTTTTSRQLRRPSIIGVSPTSALVRVHIYIDVQANDSIHFDELLDISVRRRRIPIKPLSEAYQTMLASEAVLSRDWDRPEEDEAWANL